MWLLLVALLVTSGALTAVRGLGNAQNVACSGYGYGYLNGTGYSNPAPQLSIALSTDVATAITPVVVSGYLTQNGCVLPNQTVIIKRRAVVNNIPTGSYLTVTTVTTNSAGFYSATLLQKYNSVIQATAPAAGGRPVVNSRAVLLRLFARVGASAPVSSHLYKARICGRVAPNHVGAVLSLYRGVNHVWVPKDLKRVLADNSYCFSILLPKGRTPVKIRVQTTSTNLFGQRSFYATRT
jgi:hypothetical protein